MKSLTLPMFGQDEPVTPPEFAAHARRTDPPTSHDAARRVSSRISSVRTRVLALFDTYGALTDKQLIAHYRRIYSATVAESTVRTRRSELAKEQPVPRVIEAGEQDGETIWKLRA